MRTFQLKRMLSETVFCLNLPHVVKIRNQRTLNLLGGLEVETVLAIYNFKFWKTSSNLS
jgi:hypothetical protein